MFKQYFRWSSSIQIYLIVFLMILMTFLVFLQVIARHVIPIPVPWTEELAKFCLIWVTYLGLGATFDRKVHIRIDLIDSLLKEKGKLIIEVFINLLGVIFGVFIVYNSGTFLQSQIQFGQQSPVIGLSMWMTVTPIVIGGILTIVHFLLTSIALLYEMGRK